LPTELVGTAGTWSFSTAFYIHAYILQSLAAVVSSRATIHQL
jgi:hypothetical protein